MNGPRRNRFLSDEEIELWRRVAETVAPRAGSKLPAPTPPKPASAGAAHDRPGKMASRKPTMPADKPAPSPRATLPPLAPMERQYRKKVARGRIGIERVIDLHGLNQTQAHGALRGFLRSAQAEHARLVLVVTGKGGRQGRDEHADSIGVLRRAVPHWLREADLRGVVLGFEEASLPHGGAGAIYVRLRSTRA